MAAYAELQVLIQEMLHPPILLPVPTADTLVEMLRKYARTLGHGMSGGGVRDGMMDVDVDVRRDLLAHVTCTYVSPFSRPFHLRPSLSAHLSYFSNNHQTKIQKARGEEETANETPHSAPSRPLTEHTTFLLGDIVSSLRELATLATTEAGKRVLGRYLEAREVREIGEFWDEEWVAE